LATGERVSLGKTSNWGRIVLSKQHCKDLGVQLILVCLDGFHCGAIPVYDSADSFYDYDTFNLDLVVRTLYG